MAKETLRDWFNKNDGKGWVDCKTGKPCGRKKGEKRGYPACRPTMAQCTSAAKKKKGPKAISWKDSRVALVIIVSVGVVSTTMYMIALLMNRGS